LGLRVFASILFLICIQYIADIDQLVHGQPTNGLDGLNLCQANCDSGDRLTGPTRMTDTHDHPWKVARFPTTTVSFCKLGCQLFFSEDPKNTSCKNICDFYYRIKVTTAYSDVVQEAALECRDGCDIALQVCQAGFNCRDGRMAACPAGTYREPIPNISMKAISTASTCTPCPGGRYRSLIKGQSADDCSLCPIGKYVNVTGSMEETACQRCPAGKTSAEMGSPYCVCITDESCNMTVTPYGQNKTAYFLNGVDYFRETVPFIGRW
jgi:hypothetical protein